MTTETLRQVVVCASGVLYWSGVFIQALRVRRRIGRSPNVKPKRLKERLLWLGWLVVILAWIGQPIAMNHLGRFPLTAFIGPFYGLIGLIVGLLFIVAGHAGTFWCYRTLGDSWRLGVKERERLTLVTTGLYRRIRHPIYSLQMLILLGAAYLLPTPLSLGILALHVVCCYVKALDEEAYLTRTHGQTYRDYRAHSGRFLPRRMLL